MYSKAGGFILMIGIFITTLSGAYCDTPDKSDRDKVVFSGAVQLASVPYSPFGLVWDNAVQLAIHDFTGGTGQFLGHPLLIRTLDQGCSSNPKTLIHPLIHSPTILGVVGPTCSGTTFGVLKDLSDAGLLIISPSTTSPVLTDPVNYVQWPRFFRTAGNDKFQGKVAAEFARGELQALSAATFRQPGDVYSEGIEQIFVSEFTSLGGTVAEADRFAVPPEDQSDFSAIIDALLSKPEPERVHLMFIPTFNSGAIVAALRTADPTGTIKALGSDALLESLSVPDTGLAEVYATGALLDGSNLCAVRNAYQDMFGRLPGPFEMAAYDAAMFILNAMEAAAHVEKDGRLVISRQEMVDFMNSTHNYPLLGAAHDYDAPVAGELNPEGFTTYKAENGMFVPFPGGIQCEE